MSVLPLARMVLAKVVLVDDRGGALDSSKEEGRAGGEGKARVEGVLAPAREVVVPVGAVKAVAVQELVKAMTAVALLASARVVAMTEATTVEGAMAQVRVVVAPLAAVKKVAVWVVVEATAVEGVLASARGVVALLARVEMVAL